MQNIANLKTFSYLFFLLITISSVYSWFGAKLSGDILVLCGLMFLLSVFHDLKSWNLWGFKGESRDLSNIPKTGAIDNTLEKPSSKEISDAENEPIQLMDNAKGNFLALAFEIERQLRILATVTLAKDVPATTNPKKLVDELHAVGMITDNGKAQIDAIRWLRNLLVHGRDSEINQDTLTQGITIAFNLYTEIYNWLNKNKG